MPNQVTRAHTNTHAQTHIHLYTCTCIRIRFTLSITNHAETSRKNETINSYRGASHLNIMITKSRSMLNNNNLQENKASHILFLKKNRLFLFHTNKPNSFTRCTICCLFRLNTAKFTFN